MKRAGFISALLIALTLSRPGIPFETPEVHRAFVRMGLSEMEKVREDLLRHLREWRGSSRIQLSEETLKGIDKTLRSAQVQAGSEQSELIRLHQYSAGVWAISLGSEILSVPLSPVDLENRLLLALLETSAPTREMERLEEDFLEELQRHAPWILFRGQARRLALAVASVLEESTDFEDPGQSEPGQVFEKSAQHCEKTRKNRDCAEALEHFGRMHQRMDEDLTQRMGELRSLESQIERYRSDLLASVPGANSRRMEALLREALDSHQALKRVLSLRESRTHELQWAYPELEKCFQGVPKPFEQVRCLRGWTHQSASALKQVLTGDQAAVVAKVSDFLTKIQNQAELQ